MKQVGVEEECVARLKLDEQMLKTLPSLGIVSLFRQFVVVLHVCEIDKKRGILNDQFDTLQVCAPLSHSSAWSRDLVRARDCLFGTNEYFPDDWVITYELSIQSSHLMTPS